MFETYFYIGSILDFAYTKWHILKEQSGYAHCQSITTGEFHWFRKLNLTTIEEVTQSD